jgi:peroxiredoxin 2/4
MAFLFGAVGVGNKVTAGFCGVAKERMEKKHEDVKCYDWFFCTKKLDKEKVFSTVLKK